jgi:ankyrin repeat protein
MLLMIGADPNIVDNNDASAIHLAAGVSNNSDMFTALLLQYSADPNLRLFISYVYNSLIDAVKLFCSLISSLVKLYANSMCFSVVTCDSG